MLWSQPTTASNSSGSRNPDSTKKALLATRARHVVLAFALAITAISYLDRVCISMTAPFMQKDLGLSDAEMGLVFSAFTFAYSVFEIPVAGWESSRKNRSRWPDDRGPNRLRVSRHTRAIHAPYTAIHGLHTR
jgi:sugar phosphate permease